MGNASTKLNEITNSGANIKDFNPEFDYRTKNLKRLRDAYKSLKDTLAKAMSNMEGTPQRLEEVGGGYSAVTACLNYGGGGGSATRRDMNNNNSGDAAQMNEASGANYDNENNGGASPRQPPARMDRELADESFQASKRFCEAMQTLSHTVYPKYRATLQSKVMSEVDRMIATNQRVAAQSKKTAESMSKYVAAKKTVAAREKANAKKGKDLTQDQAYMRQVSDRDTKEKLYQTDLQNFDDQYEDMMAEAQQFAADSTETFLDAVVGYFREMVETIDYTETPARSRTRARSANPNANDDFAHEESHEPTQNGSSPRPEPAVKTV